MDHGGCSPGSNPGAFHAFGLLIVTGERAVYPCADSYLPCYCRYCRYCRCYSNSSPTYSTLTLHWDGTAWSVVPSPTITFPQSNPGLTADKLVDVLALSKNDVWSLGEYTAPTNGYAGYPFTMLQHWDGIRWNILAPGAHSIGSQLTSLAAIGPNDVWAIGPALAVAHWDGSSWDEARKPDYYGQATGFEKALALPSGEILTMGRGPAGHVLIGQLTIDRGVCNATSISLVAPPTAVVPPPASTSVP